MFLWIVRPARWVTQIISGADSPRQIGSGFALGMLIGLVPKDNLCAAVLLVLLLGTRSNRAAGLLAALLFSWIGLLLDPLTHRIGYELLAYEPFRPYLGRLYALPLAPWTALHNTVVLGSLALGLVLAWPVYVLASDAAAWLKPRFLEWARRRRLMRNITGAPAAPGWRGE